MTDSLRRCVVTDRERFNAWMHFEDVDRAPVWEVIGYWPETLERWQDEGMPRDVDPRAHFGLDHYERLPIATEVFPPFKPETLLEDDAQIVYRDAEGVIMRKLKHGPRSMPQFLRHPVETREDWERFKREHLDPDSPARFPRNWEFIARSMHLRDFPTSVHAGSLFGRPRNWMGMENISYALYDDPGLVEEMARTMADLSIALLEKVFAATDQVDYAIMWEDMCFNHGCLISPRHFRRLLVPQYQRITEVLHAHGVDVILLDCDGYHDEILPLWMEGGVTGVYPLEVAAGEDAVSLRKKYPELLLVGGIDKRALARDRAAVKAEVERTVPFMLDHGGWIPSVDHSVPYDVPLENYQYYLDLVRGYM